MLRWRVGVRGPPAPRSRTRRARSAGQSAAKRAMARLHHRGDRCEGTRFRRRCRRRDGAARQGCGKCFGSTREPCPCRAPDEAVRPALRARFPGAAGRTWSSLRRQPGRGLLGQALPPSAIAIALGDRAWRAAGAPGRAFAAADATKPLQQQRCFCHVRRGIRVARSPPARLRPRWVPGRWKRRGGHGVEPEGMLGRCCPAGQADALQPNILRDCDCRAGGNHEGRDRRRRSARPRRLSTTSALAGGAAPRRAVSRPMRTGTSGLALGAHRRGEQGDQPCSAPSSRTGCRMKPWSRGAASGRCSMDAGAGLRVIGQGPLSPGGRRDHNRGPQRAATAVTSGPVTRR
jgi:hypothetical protein